MSTTRLRVLLVEDDEDDYILIQGMLSRISSSKFDLEWVATYESALPALDFGRYDICLLDYHLGKRNGVELLKAIKASYSKIPVLIITARNDDRLDEEAIRSGAEDFLLKGSLTADMLERSIRYAISRKASEEALRESEARYRAIVEDQTELIYRFMHDGTITFANEAYCSCLNRKQNELIGCCFKPFVPETDRAQVEKLLDSLCPENPVTTYDYSLRLSDGQESWHQWTIRKIFDDKNRFIEFQAVGRNITERKRMEEALQKSAERVKIFAYCVSHDLKSPVIGIHGLAELLQKKYREALGDKGKKYCDQILKASKQIVSLVDEINTFIRTKEAPLSLAYVSIKEVLQAIREEFSVQLKKGGIAWFEPETIPALRADRLSIHRAFRNFVDNALKYGGRQLSEIRIGYEESKDSHILSVYDDGTGIRIEDREKIFNAFQRNHVTEGIPGMGLGLAIVREIAERHHGSVWMEPGAERGTKFLLSIPKGLGNE